jgi:hypothetical protein
MAMYSLKFLSLVAVVNAAYSLAPHAQTRHNPAIPGWHRFPDTNSAPEIKVFTRHTLGHLFEGRTAKEWCFSRTKRIRD